MEEEVFDQAIEMVSTGEYTLDELQNILELISFTGV
jgi:hypothetical protein